MSNKYPPFLVFCWLVCCGMWVIPVQAQVPSHLQATFLLAEAQFEEGNYAEAIESYETVVQAGYQTPALQYKLAFLHERQRHYPMALFYLRQLQLTQSDERLTAKIRQLQKEIGYRPQIGEAPSAYERIVNRYHLWGLALMALLLAGAVLFQLKGTAGWTKALATLWAGMAVVLGIILLHHHFLQTPRAILIQPTSYYTDAGYASPKVSLPLAPGHTVKVEEVHDIWCKISLGSSEGWVPRFVLREL